MNEEGWNVGTGIVSLEEMNVREIEAGDAEALIELRGRTRENAISREALAQMGITAESVGERLRSTHRGWLWEEDGGVVGFAIGDGSNGELWVIAVTPEFEGRGVGSRLLALVESWLWGRGWDALWLWTDADESRRAFEFYLRHGWVKGEVRDGALFMRKEGRNKEAGLGEGRLFQGGDDEVVGGVRQEGPEDGGVN